MNNKKSFYKKLIKDYLIGLKGKYIKPSKFLSKQYLLEKKLILSTKISSKLKETITLLNPLLKLQNLQDYFEQKLKSKNDEVVLQQAKFWAEAITWTLIGGTTFALGWLALAKTEEIVIAQGKLEPKSGVIEVQMPLEGITKRILVKEGDRVKKGQILIQLDTEVSEANQISLLKTLEINQQILDSLKYLAEEGAASKIQYLQQANKVQDIKTKIKENEVKIKYQKIASPVNGIVFDMQPKGPGYVARTSQPVLKVVPLDKLQAEVEINSSDIGFINIGKRTDISIDSFPSSDFGVIEGKIIRIGSDALPPDPRLSKGYRFPAIIKLDNQNLELKSGKKLPLQAGMSITANIKLRKVSYLQLLLNNFSDKAATIKQL
tara:strand:+ start:1495 stop:2625 length:1131 start_codon:yes stop_codon:yes gene_type:complete